GSIRSEPWQRSLRATAWQPTPCLWGWSASAPVPAPPATIATRPCKHAPTAIRARPTPCSHAPSGWTVRGGDGCFRVALARNGHRRRPCALQNTTTASSFCLSARRIFLHLNVLSHNCLDAVSPHRARGLLYPRPDK